MSERDEDLDDLNEGFDQIQTRDIDGLDSQPSIQGIENNQHLGGNADVTGKSNRNVVEELHEKIDMASAEDFESFKA